MTRFALLRKVSVLVLLVAGINLPAQELSFLGGLMNESNPRQSSYTWQVDYRQDLYEYLAASAAYLNEGHVPGHHRDGTAFELWGRLPFDQDSFALSLGVGAYYFYDTQLLPGGDSANIHGTAPIFSLSGTGYLSDRWFYRIMVNRINPANDIKVNTVAVGVGYWFGKGGKPTRGNLGDAPDEHGYVTENQLTVFGGQSVVNTFLSQQARAYAIEYRRGLMPHLDWTLSGIYEGAPQIIRRSGVATQVWPVNTFFSDRVAVGLGIGPYFYIDKKHPVSPAQKIPAAVAPLLSLGVSVRLNDDWFVRAVWDRVTTGYNRDSDIFLVGLGYSWAR